MISLHGLLSSGRLVIISVNKSTKNIGCGERITTADLSVLFASKGGCGSKSERKIVNNKGYVKVEENIESIEFEVSVLKNGLDDLQDQVRKSDSCEERKETQTKGKVKK